MKRYSRISTTQLARICGVSQGTVDRALHDRGGIRPETKARILAVAREYNYLPHVKGADGTHSMLIGVLLFDLRNAYFSKLAMSFVHTAKQYGYSVIFQFSEKEEKAERDALEYFRYIGVDGIVLFSAGSDSPEYAQYLRSLQIPLVLVGNRLFDLPYIGIDDEAAMYALTVRLAEEVTEGDLLYFAPALKDGLHTENTQRHRLRGFTRAAEDLHRSTRAVTDLADVADFGGIVCSTDYYALQVLHHLGYPKEIKIAGVDNISFLQSLPCPILSVEYSTDRIAAECFNYLLGLRFTAEIPHSLILHNP